MRNTPLNLLKDQKEIWTSPLRIRESNALTPVFLVLGTTVLITTDHQVMSSSTLQNKSLNNEAVNASDGLAGAFIAAPAAIYGMGLIRHDDHASETGILGGEAIADSLVVSEVIKIVSQRERPTVDNAKGKFFQTQCRLRLLFSVEPQHHRLVFGGGDCLGIRRTAHQDHCVRARHGREPDPGDRPAAFSIGCAGGQRGRMAHWALRRPSPFALGRFRKPVAPRAVRCSLLPDT